MKGYVTEATHEHCVWLAPRLRKEDREECKAGFGAAPELALPLGLAASERAWTMIGKSGNPIGIFGVAPGNSDIDRSIWMLCTPEIEDNAVQFLRECKWWINELNKIYPVLWNWVDSRNALHIKWLRWLGCLFINRGPLVHGGPDFIHFVRIHNVPSNGGPDGAAASRWSGSGHNGLHGSTGCV